ncbi:prolyl oligopeptidase family protein [Novosphingobium tardum]|uniref:prolyl oligopeptidase n=1 Tax=Novosphingobium tardum TaxID=1538021 RepID=A0ABV8RMJ3_9SPHN
MRPLLAALLLTAGTAAVAATPASRLMPAPVFPAGNTVDTIQGVKVADPYRALENGDDPKVEAWSDAQNDRTRAYLDNLPGRQAVVARLTSLIKASSPAYYGLQAHGPRVFATYSDPAHQQPMLVTMNAAADPASRQPLVDPNTLDPAGHTAIDWYVASPDGTKVAVSLSKNGSEDGTLHVFDAATGREIETPIDRVQYPTGGGSLAWAGDSQGFWYTRYPDTSAPESERHFHLQAYWHKLGTPIASDRLVLGEKDGLPRTAEVFLDNGEGGANALASVQLGDGGQWQHYVLTPGGKAIQIGKYADRVIGGAVIARDGTVYGVSRLDPMGRVVRLAAPYKGGFAAAKAIIAAQSGAAIIDGGPGNTPLVLAGKHLFVSRIAGGPTELTSYDLAGGHPAKVALPPLSSVGEIAALPDGSALYDVSTYLAPPRFMRWDAATGKVSETALAVTSPISFADAEVTRIFATSKDGTKVPVSVIAKKGIKLDGSHPVLLYGYGGYGVNTVPGFAGTRARLFLDGGGIYAIANIRGGGEYGQKWHEQGMLTKKQNVFDDFAAAGEDLIRRGYTSHQKLSLLGGSNGGLLMGAEITQHPGLARAVVSAVGIYDMMRVELDPNGAFNITEFGTVKDPAQFKALYAYSPYHRVAKGTKYPAVLMLTGANDGRVNPLNSRKFAAALQAANAGDNPILLRTSKTSGHGIGSSLDERIGESADILMFLFDQLDMDAAAAGRGN